MKKILFLSTLCALALCSCSKDQDEKGNSFGRAEIRFELTGPEFHGNPSSDILNYCEFTVYGTDFEGNEIRKDLCTGAHDTVIVCTKAPAKDKSVFATLCTKASAETLPEGQYSVDYSFRVTYAVYDEKGNELSSGFVTRTSSTGILSATEFQNEMAGNRLNKKFELYCDETDGKSEYGFAWKDAGPM